jgi:hypothetical protein
MLLLARGFLHVGVDLQLCPPPYLRESAGEGVFRSSQAPLE